MTEESKGTLISSKNVSGTEVYCEGESIGTIDHLLIDKTSGKIAYAIMGFGGFLGMGEDHLPIPWDKLTFDTERECYVTDLTEEEVTSAPERHDNWYGDRDWERRTHEHYGVPQYWA
ncbi:PRC-barrel domain-containing protein [Sulfitobacter sp. HNIBRBA3233]|uniref:PRC-barrel domain-containing protein n=1 Tax=Sulfitobacter marinivivus TaxID=3158558 RepID=UPI0032DE37D3